MTQLFSSAGRSAAKDVGRNILPVYPADHPVGERVPKGGSNCKKCPFLKDAENRICGHKKFMEWQGANKPAGSPEIPYDVDEYCCDFFPEVRKGV